MSTAGCAVAATSPSSVIAAAVFPMIPLPEDVNPILAAGLSNA
jgi:hypothetical protein